MAVMVQERCCCPRPSGRWERTPTTDVKNKNGYVVVLLTRATVLLRRLLRFSAASPFLRRRWTSRRAVALQTPGDSVQARQPSPRLGMAAAREAPIRLALEP